MSEFKPAIPTRAPVSQRGHFVPPASNPDAIGAKVRVNIDGMDIQVPIGTTILEFVFPPSVITPIFVWLAFAESAWWRSRDNERFKLLVPIPSRHPLR